MSNVKVSTLANGLRVAVDEMPEVESASLGVEMVADILRNSVFDPDELQRERGVILQEIGQALDTPDDVIFDQFQETALPGQPLGRPVLGTAATVEAIGRDD